MSLVTFSPLNYKWEELKLKRMYNITALIKCQELLRNLCFVNYWATPSVAPRRDNWICSIPSAAFPRGAWPWTISQTRELGKLIVCLKLDRHTKQTHACTRTHVCLHTDTYTHTHTHIHTHTAHCSPYIEYIMLQCRPFYLPWEITSVSVTAVFEPPQANSRLAMEKLHHSISQH